MREQKKTRPTGGTVEREMVEAVGMGHSYIIYIVIPQPRPLCKRGGDNS